MKNDRVNNYNRAYYVNGNTARNVQTVPDYLAEEQPLKREQPSRREQPERNRRVKTHTGMDAFSFLFFAIAVSITLYTCIEYLSVQNNITQMEKKAAVLESELVKLENENRAASADIDTSLDLNYIYKVATTKLGMVYPDGNQVITYKSTLSDYVRQYEEIPKENSSDLLSDVLK